MATRSLTDFLAKDLRPHTPSNSDEECSICTVSWRNNPQEVSALPCLHHFHKACIKQWVTDGVGKVATCPFCRLELCERPAPILREWDWALTDLEPLQSFGWEGLDAAVDRVRTQLSSIYSLTRRVWADREPQRTYGRGEEDSDEWAAVVSDVLAAINASIVQPLAPGSATEYAVVKAIVDSLRECWFEEGFDTSDLEVVLDVLDDYEEHAEFRSIEEAYQGVGLGELAALVLGGGGSDTEEDALLASLEELGLS